MADQHSSDARLPLRGADILERYLYVAYRPDVVECLAVLSEFFDTTKSAERLRVVGRKLRASEMRWRGDLERAEPSRTRAEPSRIRDIRTPQVFDVRSESFGQIESAKLDRIASDVLTVTDLGEELSHIPLLTLVRVCELNLRKRTGSIFDDTARCTHHLSRDGRLAYTQYVVDEDSGGLSVRVLARTLVLAPSTVTDAMQNITGTVWRSLQATDAFFQAEGTSGGVDLRLYGLAEGMVEIAVRGGRRASAEEVIDTVVLALEEAAPVLPVGGLRQVMLSRLS